MGKIRPNLKDRACAATPFVPAIRHPLETAGGKKVHWGAIALNRGILKTMEPVAAKWTTKLVQGQFPDRSFDIEFWQAQGDEAIFSAAWDMIELAEELKYGRKPRLQRSVTRLQQMRS